MPAAAMRSSTRSYSSLREGERHAHPGARHRLDAVVLVVLAQQVAGDAEQPGRTRAVCLVAEALHGAPGLCEGLRSQVECGGLGARLALEPRTHPGGVPV